MKQLIDKIDVIYHSLLADHLRSIKVEADDFGREDLAKEADGLLKRLEPSEE